MWVGIPTEQPAEREGIPMINRATARRRFLLGVAVAFFNATAFAATHSIWQRTVIFSVCLGINMVADVFKVMMAGSIREKLTVHNISLINKVSGTILMIFGLALLYGVIFIEPKVG